MKATIPPPPSLFPDSVTGLTATLPRSSTVLVVDGDGVTRRMAEHALSKSGEFVVEGAKDGASGLEVLRTTLVDLIICETTLPDMSGIQFRRALAREERFKAIPALVLSAESRVSFKAAYLKEGFHDYLVKPCDPVELASRCTALVGRQRDIRASLRKRSYTLAGELSAIPFPDLVVMLEMGNRTGILRLITRKAEGTLYFENGQLFHVVYGSLSGEKAFYRMMGEASGRFEFTAGPHGQNLSDATISVNVTALLMEGARLLDEGLTTKDAGSGRPLGGLGLRRSEPPPSVRILPGLAPSKNLALSFLDGVRDTYALAELDLFNADELRAWTQRDDLEERFHALLLADLRAGVSAMLSLASPPGESVMVHALAAEPKVLTATFTLRSDRSVDVLLLDIRSAATFQNELRRVPCLAIVAMPDGDPMAVGVKGRAELESLLTALAPTGILAVGNESVETSFRDLGPVRHGVSKLGTVRGPFGEDNATLRDLLVEGIGLWSSNTGGRGVSKPATIHLASEGTHGK